MKGKEALCTQHGDFGDPVFLPPAMDDRVVLTTSGPVREALERHMVVDQMGEHEVVFERRYLGRWVYKDK